MSRTRVKICGTTNVDDARLAHDAGADAIGLIFAPGSKRRVDVETARTIGASVGPALARIGVFRDAGLDEVLRTAHAARLSAVQIHGEASELYIDALLRYHPVLRALRPGEAVPAARPGLSLLFDAVEPGAGVPFDWAATSLPPGSWLAGGLGPHNVAEAMRVLKPVGVDAVSALERAPGLKDPARVRAFVRAVRETYPQE